VFHHSPACRWVMPVVICACVEALRRCRSRRVRGRRLPARNHCEAGVGNPGLPVLHPRLGSPGAPLGRGAVRQAHHRWGNPGSPYVHLRPHARSAHRRDDHGVSLGGPPPPWPSPAGGGNRASPTRQGGGATQVPRMFTSAVYAAAPHNTGMKICVLGRAVPSQTLPRAGYFHLSL